ncbi:amino acid permease-domain-containing protein [Gigaspora rosea]|uniref:Amino acid permease-domain-containing protein n=1 Tax=Gigaspora rosea TaxID=44941 RepID=A0A397US94_9GLOM|nr:amino acid permease-domain-containing protein [Gigaspora rosea]
MDDKITLNSDNSIATSTLSRDNSTITNSKKTLGILYGIGYNINYIIGAGIFNPDSLWILAPPGTVLVLYVVCGIISFFGSLVYIELGIRSLPSGIGEQKYITDAFHPKENVGHVFSFAAIFIILPGAIVAESYINAQYLLYPFRGNLSDDQIISMIGIGKLVTNHNNWNNIFNASFNFGVYGSRLIKVLFTYEDLIEEFKPRSDNLEYPSLILKYSSLISVGISFLLNFLTNAAFITVVGYNVNDNENTPIAIRFGRELFDGKGEKLMSILAAISAFGCTSAMIFTYSRIIKYAADTEFIPRKISSFFKSYGNSDTLTKQLLAQFCYCLILTIILLIEKLSIVFDFFSNASQYTAMIFHGASAYCLYRLKKRNLRNPETFSVYKPIVISYLLIIIYIIGASFYPPNGKWDDLIPYGISWTTIVLGLIIWYFRNRHRNENSNGEVYEMNEHSPPVNNQDN